MTDLISSLADAIVALINAKPQSPTKAEVEEVLRVPILRLAVDAGMFASFPGMLRRYETDARGDYDPSNPANHTDLNEASLEAAISRIKGRWVGDRQDKLNPSWVAVWRREGRAPTYNCYDVVNGEPVPGRNDRSDNLGSSDRPRDACKFPTPELAEIAAAHASRMYCGDFKVERWCPSSTNGSHAWTYHVNADECRCPCGARAEGYKP